MKQYNFVDKEFYDLTSEDIKNMRRGEYLSRIPMSDFLTHYNITAWEYCNRLRELKGLSLVKDERKAWIDEKKEKEKLMPQADHTFRVENLPDIFVAAMYEVDFEVVKGRRLYDVEELEKAREDIGNKVERYLHLIQETSNNMAYSKLRGIDLIAMRIYRGLNRQAFSKISRLKLSDIKHFESLQQKIPKYIETTYREKLNIRKRHIIQLREIMEGKSDKVVEDREIPKLVKLRVYQRDKGKCTECGTKDKKLHFHHIKHFADGGQHTVENLKLLCVSCHAEAHKGETVYHLLKSQAQG